MAVSNLQHPWTYQLSPKQVGIITIAPIHVSGEKTQALQLTVNAAQNNSQSAYTDDIFTEVELDRDSAYVQQQILLTIRINDSKGMRNIGLENINLTDAFVKEISNTFFDRSINGRNYRTYQIQYAIFAQKSGSLTIPAININGEIIDSSRRSGFFGPSTKPVRLITDSQSIVIKPPIITATNDTWLAAKNLQVKEIWSQDPNNLIVGDSITRTTIISATGLTGEQLPILTLENIKGVKYYSDKADVSDKIQNTDIVSRRTERHTLVFTEAGTVTLPKINIPWFNTVSENMQLASLKEMSFHIKPNPTLQQATQLPIISNPTIAAAINTSALATNNMEMHTNHTDLWRWQISTAIGFLLATIFATLLFIAYRKSHLSPKIVESKNIQHFDLNTLKRACTQQQHAAIKQQVMAWAKQYFAPQVVYSLSDVRRLSTNEQLQDHLDELERACYGQVHQLISDALYIEIESAEKSKRNTHSKGLKNLYPI